MLDVRKYAIVLVVAVLFAVFIFSSIEAVYPEPEWGDYCNEPMPRKVLVESCEGLDIPPQEEEECLGNSGRIQYSYDGTGCPSSWTCSTCEGDYEKDRDKHGLVAFIIASILGLIGIAVGLLLPGTKSELHEWVGTGVMLGGIFCIFVTTMQNYDALHRIVRPFVILAELGLVIFLAYKKMQVKKKKS